LAGAADAWAALATAALARSAAALADDAQLLGVPAAALPPLPARADGRAWPPWRVSRIAGPSAAARLDGALVVDLSSMWAGPLCARLLGRGGARVVKVETPDRPDGARAGNRDFFDWLHAGQQSVALDFRSAAGRDALGALLAAADVVIEASRPRALEQAGLAPAQRPHRAGQVWLSITGYGRGRPDRVAFGDDAAVAGGLVAWVLGPGGGGHEPVFCADAVADPLTGVCGALAVARSLADGGGQLIDLPMRAVAAGFAAADLPTRRILHPGSHQAWRSEAGTQRHRALRRTRP
jgi:crotonobetainyl-CoA:carnitine CoA-transferase CaiB-like acyl-CoA transferase